MFAVYPKKKKKNQIVIVHKNFIAPLDNKKRKRKKERS